MLSEVTAASFKSRQGNWSRGEGARHAFKWGVARIKLTSVKIRPHIYIRAQQIVAEISQEQPPRCWLRGLFSIKVALVKQCG